MVNIPLDPYFIMNHHIPDTELFIVERDKQAAICYSPLKDEICLIDIESAQKLYTLPPHLYDEELRELIKEIDSPVPEFCKTRIPDIQATTKLSIIPNNICNLTCSYCYSAKGRNNLKLNIDQIDTALNWFIDPSRIDGDFISIFITGGGEPLATWDITSHIITDSRKRADQQGLKCHISVITNGTLVTDDKIQFFTDHGCSVGVSFDVIEDVQNSNRGKYDLVKKNIKSLLAAGLRVMVNSTIIPSSVGRMTQAVNEVIAEYPGLAQYTMEPATGTDIFGSPEAMRNFYDTFLYEYFQAKAIAKKHGINLRFTLDDSLRGITTRHCPGKFVLTPTGHISVCHLVSSPMESRFGDCIYGKINDGNVDIDAGKFQSLFDRNLFAYEECADCIAKWSCGGECFTRRNTYAPEYMAEVCRFNRNVIELLLKEKVKDVTLS